MVEIRMDATRDRKTQQHLVSGTERRCSSTFKLKRCPLADHWKKPKQGLQGTIQYQVLCPKTRKLACQEGGLRTVEWYKQI